MAFHMRTITHDGRSLCLCACAVLCGLVLIFLLIDVRPDHDPLHVAVIRNVRSLQHDDPIVHKTTTKTPSTKPHRRSTTRIPIRTRPPTHFGHSTTLVTRRRCSGHHLNVLLLISVDVKRVYQRNTIRMTWGRDTEAAFGKKARWKTWFLTGKRDDDEAMRQIRWESNTQRDIVFGDFYENYYHQSYKVEMGFEWAHRYCDYEFLFKGDDDVFVHLPNLLAFLEPDYPDVPKKELYMGYVNFDAPVHREGKFAVAYEEFNETKYPPYCSGGGFIMSSQVVSRIQPHFNLRNKLKIDDAYVGILAKKAGVRAWSLESFGWFDSDEAKFQFFKKGCFTNGSDYIVQHPVKTRGCMWHLYTNTLYTLDAQNYISLPADES